MPTLAERGKWVKSRIDPILSQARS